MTPQPRYKQRDPMGYVTEYAYDAVGNLISATLPNGETYAYTYNHSASALLKPTRWAM